MEKYSLSMRILHWLMAIFIICMLSSGIIMSYYLEPPFKYEIYTIHKACGITVLGLLIIRFCVRLGTKLPKFPEGISNFEKSAAKLAHYLLYLIVFIIVISGYVMSSASERPITWFNIFDIPLLISKNEGIAKFAHYIHETLPYVLIVLIIIHILAPIKHILIDKVNILKRML